MVFHAISNVHFWRDTACHHIRNPTGIRLRNFIKIVETMFEEIYFL